ncbi:TPR repeat-containing protein [Methanolobus vulcani]|uniref:TPR repeat-containing protein n=1 Tax=Methanolobus vulcani TaxID=38026 RepID=A0A7Z7AZT7_9EURY|nr:tetratricopeptide repeat protein [Methanolobus vulcani]SDF84974.1 TPR repeat-containing protein [Methanolobus vulcani]
MGMLDDVKSKKKQKAAENWIKMGDSAKTLEKQVEYYTKSLDIDPYSAEAWFKKGKALEKMGHFEEAKKSFDLAIEVDPDYQGLIGATAGSSASVNSAPLVEKDVYEAETPPTPIIEEEIMEEELLSEPEIVTPSEPSDEGVSSYRPPVGDESIFSNVISDDDSDNVSPSYVNEDYVEEQEELIEDIDTEPEVNSYLETESVSEPASESETSTEQDSGYESQGEPEENVFGRSSVSSSESTEHDVISGSSSVVERDEPSVFSSHEPMEEKEDTFSSPSAPAPQEPVSSYKDDENIIRRTEPETIRSAPVSTPANTPVAASVPPMSEAPKRQAVGYNSSSSSIAGSKPVAISGADLVDIRIPLNETLKFWAVGVVAMLIVLILSKII